MKIIDNFSLEMASVALLEIIAIPNVLDVQISSNGLMVEVHAQKDLTEAMSDKNQTKLIMTIRNCYGDEYPATLETIVEGVRIYCLLNQKEFAEFQAKEKAGYDSHSQASPTEIS